jgi:hypothetical protein
MPGAASRRQPEPLFRQCLRATLVSLEPSFPLAKTRSDIVSLPLPDAFKALLRELFDEWCERAAAAADAEIPQSSPSSRCGLCHLTLAPEEPVGPCARCHFHRDLPGWCLIPCSACRRRRDRRLPLR